MEQQQQVQRGNRVVLWTATGFGLGYAPIAPGTFGTLAAIPLFLLLRDLPALVYGAAVLVLFCYGVWSCGIAERYFGRHDHGAVVMDEIVGYLIAMYGAPRGWEWIAVGFVFFRVFDIWKPYPINRLDTWPGGFGSMVDDAMAGVYALIALQTAAWIVQVYVP